MRDGHPLLDKGLVSPADLRGYDWVFQPPGTLLRRAVEDSFLSAGVPLPENIINTSSMILTCSIVCETNAIAPVARDVADLIASHGMRSRRCAHPADRFQHQHQALQPDHRARRAPAAERQASLRSHPEAEHGVDQARTSLAHLGCPCAH